MTDAPLTVLRPCGRAPGTTRLAIGVLAALLLAGCGGQIPFGTPRAGAGGPPGPSAVAPGTPASSGAPSGAASTQPSAAISPAVPASPAASDEPTDAPLPSPGTVAVTYSLAEAGIAVTLPPGWVGYDASAPEAALDAALREHPELLDAFDRLRTGQLSFVAVDASATGEGIPASMTIGLPFAAVPPGPLLEAFANQLADAITRGQPVDGEVAIVPVELETGPTVNLRWTLQAQGDAEAVGFDAYVVSLGRAYLVTFAAPVSAIDGFRPVFEEIVASITSL